LKTHATITHNLPDGNHPRYEAMIHLERLSQRQSEIVGEALRAAVDGPFFPESEFRALFGFTRAEIRAVADAWPLPLADPETVAMAVNHTLNLLLSYPHEKDEALADFISVGRAELNDLLIQVRGRRRGNENHFERFRMPG
jgi:hypothetical protein